MGVFTRAGPAEVLRAAQKDESAIKTIQKMFEDVAVAFGGPIFSMKHKQHILALSNLFYYSNTTLCGLQTLGEEYTGIVQVDKSLKRIPHFLNRLLMIVLESYGLVITKKMCKSVENYITKSNDILPEAKEKLLYYLDIVTKLLPYIDNFHRAFFFCHWSVYHLSKRIAGIHYILTRFWLKDRQSLPAFRILGGITLLQLIISAFVAIYKLYSTNFSSARSQDSSMIRSVDLDRSKKCAMCLSCLKHPTCTPCGHIFCWNCILEWLQSENQCPICREPIKTSRLVPLQNFI